MSAQNVIIALNNMPVFEAINTLDFLTSVGKQTCEIIRDMPFTDAWAEAGIEGYWIQSDFNGDGVITNDEGYDLVQLCGAIADNWEVVTGFLNSF